MTDSGIKGGFPPEFIERVLDSIDPVQIFGKYTNLKRSGKSFKGLCPFHREKTPSFFVDPDRGLFYCFGCGKGGNVITFLMEKEGMSFPEAVEYLAKEAGIPLPERKVIPRSVQSLHQAVEVAHRFYHEKLFSPEGKTGLDYLSGRGISVSMARRTELGWASPEWDSLKKFVEKRGLPLKPFIDTGLLIENQQTGSVYDRFRGGVIIPIRSTSGKVVGFGMRVLDPGDGPKYINSPDSPIFHKSEILFGLSRARQAIRKAEYAVLVEGYFDVLSLWQAGIENVVASCGTAFTPQHANLLARFTKKVVIFYDGDTAGLKATYRALKSLLRYELVVRIARPPEGMDPDDLARQWNAAKLEKFFHSAPDWFDFSVEIARRQTDWSQVEAKLHFADRIGQYIYILGDSLLGELYRKKLAEILGVTEGTVAKRIAKSARGAGEIEISSEEQRQKESLSSEGKIELDIMAKVIANPLLAEVVERRNLFVLYRGAAERMLSVIAQRGECSLGLISEYLDAEGESYLAQRLFAMEKELPTREEVEQLLSYLENLRIDREIEQLQIALKQAEQSGNSEEIDRILKKITDLKKKRINFNI